MATPTKAFHDPTAVSRFFWSPVLNAMGSVGVFSAAKAYVITPSPINLLAKCGPVLQTLWNQQGCIPPPPMGRMMLSTFPPIYRERGSSSNRPLDGQTWPRFAKSGQD